jgi:Ca2+-binding EF-hand superfamily protein
MESLGNRRESVVPMIILLIRPLDRSDPRSGEERRAAVPKPELLGGHLLQMGPSLLSNLPILAIVLTEFSRYLESHALNLSRLDLIPPLLAMTTTGGSMSTLMLESIDGIIFSLGRSRSGSVGYQSEGNSVRFKVGNTHIQTRSEISDRNEDPRVHGTSTIVKLLWGLFLKSFERSSPRSTKRCKDYILEARQNGALEYLVHLSHSFLGRPSNAPQDPQANLYQDNPSGSDMTVYCIILQEVVNAIIDHTSFDDDVVNMEAMSSLIEMIYRSDAQLCTCVWDRWVTSASPGRISEQNFPICKLIKMLVETSFHEPQHLLKVLVSLTCSSVSAREVALILAAPVSIISWVSWDSVRVGSSRMADGSINWIGGRDWLRSQGTKIQNVHLPILLETVKSHNERVQSSFLVEPATHTIGMMMQSESQSILVKWQGESTWLAVVMNALESASIHLQDDQQSLTVNALCLLASIIRSSNESALTTLASDWTQLTLYSFLRTLDALEVYPVMCKEHLTIKDLQRDPMAFYQKLLDHGAHPSQARVIADNCHAYRLPEFDNFVIESAVALMSVFISRLLSLPNSVSGSILDPWRELLAGSLSLLSCIAKTSPSVSTALTILRSIAKTYGIGSWTEILFSLSTHLEAQIGRYDVTKQTTHLLSILSAKIQAPSPANSVGLDAVFRQFDLDGNGTISPDELRQGLANMGYEVTISAIDNFFQQIDGGNSSSLHFSQLLRYAASTVSQLPTDFTASTLSNAAQIGISDLHRAQLGLSMLLHDVIYPESRESSQLAESLAMAVTVYCTDCLAQMNRWTYISLLHKSELALSCLQILSSILSASSFHSPSIIRTPAVTQACEYFFQRFGDDKQLQESLVQSCLDLSLSALQMTFTTPHRETSRSLKSFISEPTTILPGTDSGGLQPNILPVNFFSGLVGKSAPLHVDLMEDISVQTMQIFIQILEMAAHPSEVESSQSLAKNCAIQLVDILFSSAGASATGLFGNFMANPLLTAHSSSAITNIDLPCLYFAVLVSFLDYPSSPLTPTIGYATTLPTVAGQLLGKLIVALQVLKGPKSRRSFVDGLGYQNILPFCQTVCAWIRSKTNPGLKHVLLDLLLTLSNCEPLVIVLLLNVPADASADERAKMSHPVRPDNSLLATTIDKFLQKSEYLYENHPILLGKLFELILSFIERSNHLSIGHLILNLARTTNFWDSITVPLMSDVPPTPTPGPGDSQDASQYLHGFALEMQYERSGLTSLHCSRLKTHALALRILARERFGTMFFIDTTDLLLETRASDKDQRPSSPHHGIAEKIEKIVDAFFERANNSHRFLSWVKHYMRVEINYSLQQEAEENAKSICLNFGSLLAKPRAPSVGLPPYGGSYIYSFRVAERMRDIVQFHSVKASVGRDSNSLANWNQLLRHIVDLNCMWSVADSQVSLTRFHQFTIFLDAFASKLERVH